MSGTGTGTPVILIHGGPGVGSFYVNSMEGLGVDRPVVRDDQRGAGKSDRPTDTTLMVIPRYVEELDALRRTLKYERVFLNAKSWGTIVAFEYTKRTPIAWPVSSSAARCSISHATRRILRPG